MKSLIITITILAWVGMIVGIVALAADEGTVAATVTAQQISIVVTPGSVAYGSVALGATDDTIATAEPQWAENNGNAAADFNIKGSNSASWSIITGVPSGEDYRHRFATDSGAWIALDTSYVDFFDDVAENATQGFDLEILISTGTAITAEQNVNVWLQAVTP